MAAIQNIYCGSYTKHLLWQGRFMISFTRRFFLLLSLLFAMSGHLYASTLDQNVPVDAYFDKAIELNSQSVFHITEPQLLLSDVQKLEDWQAYDSFKAVPENKVIWLSFAIQNNSNTNKMLTLIAGNIFVDQIDAFLIDEQGRITQSGNLKDLNRSTSDVSKKGFKMNLVSRSETTYRVFIRVQDDSNTLFPIELWQQEAYAQESNVRLILLGVMSGGLSLLACYFLLTYILKNSPARFWFALFSSSAMTTMLSAEGIISSLFNVHAFSAEITVISLVLTLFTTIKITRIIFAPMPSWWIRAHYLLLLVPLIATFTLSDLHQLTGLIVFALLFFISKLIASIVYRKGLDVRSAAIYFLGWIALAFVALMELNNFLSSGSELSLSAPYAFTFTCFGVMLIGIAIINTEQSIQARVDAAQTKKITDLQDYKNLFEYSAEGLYTATQKGEIIKVNQAMCHLFGCQSEQEFLVQYPKLEDVFKDRKEADLLFGELSIQHTVLGKEVKGKRTEGNEFWMSVSCQLKKIDEEYLHFGSLFDITERRLQHINLQYLNTHDQLTGLFNRRHFLHLLNEKIQNNESLDSNSSSKENQLNKFALMFLDVDQFKIINDTCGHTAGDIFIKDLSHELFDVVGKENPLARLSADQFGLLIHYENGNELRMLASKILSKVRQFEFKWDRHLFNQSMSIGIAAYEPLIENGEELLSCADTACLIAKEGGRDKIHIYSKELGVHSNYKRELYWVNEVQNAIKHDNFSLYYQHYRPLNQNDPLEYYEVLVRLFTRDQDLVAPEFFMPSAEKGHISHKIDKYVVEHFFKWLSKNDGHLKKLGKANINLSGMSLSDDDFKFFLLNAFEKYAIPHDKICFEITETMAIIKMKDAIDFMQDFRKLGCTFALDDFGSGFSSYSYLKNLPVDYLKIDGNFIRDILHDPIDLAMVTSIRDVADAMKIKTVAEFVETPEIMVQIGKLGVDFAQGYCIDKPTALSEYQDYGREKA